jgi:hypothetical protein
MHQKHTEVTQQTVGREEYECLRWQFQKVGGNKVEEQISPERESLTKRAASTDDYRKDSEAWRIVLAPRQARIITVLLLKHRSHVC